MFTEIRCRELAARENMMVHISGCFAEVEKQDNGLYLCCVCEKVIPTKDIAFPVPERHEYSRDVRQLLEYIDESGERETEHALNQLHVSLAMTAEALGIGQQIPGSMGEPMTAEELHGSANDPRLRREWRRLARTIRDKARSEHERLRHLEERYGAF